MKLHRFGALTALLTATALFGCSSDKNPQVGDDGASVSVNLTTTEGVVINQIHWELRNQPIPGSLVFEDYLLTPGQTVPRLTIESLAFGSYYLEFDAEGTYDPDGAGPLPAQTVPCTSNPADGAFSISAAAPNYTFPSAITLTCNLEVAVNNTGSVNADVQVVVDTVQVGNVTEPFSHGNSSVGAEDAAGNCVFPGIPLKVFANPANGVTYTWSDNDPAGGTFVFTNGTNTVGTYTCGSGGTKTITLTGTTASASNSISFPVTCDDSACNVPLPVCGDGLVNQPGVEECDEASSRCVNCLIVPNCGDGVVDGPNGACAGGTVNKPACNEQCDPLGNPNCTAQCTAPVFCGDGVVNQPSEQCDNGAANSDTTPNACRTDCALPTCGDNVVDTGEACDDGNTTAGDGCSATCTVEQQASLWDTCRTCIPTDENMTYLQELFCPGFAGACGQIEECVINDGCYLPVLSDCYCGPGGIDFATCSQPTFQPTGTCAPLIRAATGNLSNSDTLVAMTQTSNASGQALIILSEASQTTNSCHTACFNE